MTADRIRAELAVMEACEEEFRQVHKDLCDHLEDLDNRLATLLEDWHGPARDAYREAHATWASAARDMADQLSVLHKVIIKARRHYRTSLDANHLMWHPE